MELNADQAKAIAEIEKLGGKVTVDEKSPGKPVMAVDLVENQGDRRRAGQLLETFDPSPIAGPGVYQSDRCRVGVSQELSQLQSLNLTENHGDRCWIGSISKV